jgi:epoxyqueuosine reductase
MQKNMDCLENILSDLNSISCNAAIFSTEHITEVQDEIEYFLSKGFIDKNLYEDELGIYFKFDWEKVYEKAKSVLIISIPNLAVSVYFNIKGDTLKTVIPPTYIYKMAEEKVKNILNQNLPSGSYTSIKNMLPLKLLAVKSGIGKYGRNNVCYVEGMGSHYRLMGFYLNIQADIDSWNDLDWNELNMLERCKTCTNCIKICPTKCIAKDRFIIRAERCLTYFNESEKVFPTWIKKEWHNALVGCMKCQEVCPENKNFTGKSEGDFYFNEIETTKILKNKSLAGLEDKTIKKFQDLGLENDIFIISRNLEALIK